MKESLAAVKTLYNLALFCSNETEFSDLFGTITKLRSVLQAEQCNSFKDTKITLYFQSSATKKGEMEAENTVVDERDVIMVD